MLKVLYRQLLLKEYNAGYYGSGNDTKSGVFLL